MVEPLCNLIREYGREDWVVVRSFSEPALQEFRNSCPEIATMGMASEIKAYIALIMFFLSAAWQPSTEIFSVPEYFGDTYVLSPSFVANARQHNVRIYPWTINTAEDMKRLIDLGVDGLITAYPTLAMELTRQ